jgi:RNA polymerase sigma-70 factor (ECF subfamily)
LLTTAEGTELEAGRHEALSMAMLQVLNRLDPMERAVFLLHEVFSYPFDDIARFVGKREDHCRQMAQRAATRVRAERPRVEADAAAHQRLLTSILGAATKGDLARLEGLLTEDVTLYSDGGGRAMAATNPVVGPDPVARFMVGISAHAAEETTTDVVVLNGLPGVVVRVAGVATTTASLDVREGKVCRVYVVRNPQKLKGL